MIVSTGKKHEATQRLPQKQRNCFCHGQISKIPGGVRAVHTEVHGSIWLHHMLLFSRQAPARLRSRKRLAKHFPQGLAVRTHPLLFSLLLHSRGDISGPRTITSVEPAGFEKPTRAFQSWAEVGWEKAFAAAAAG